MVCLIDVIGWSEWFQERSGFAESHGTQFQVRITTERRRVGQVFGRQ